jgi:hypothetical protein
VRGSPLQKYKVPSASTTSLPLRSPTNSSINNFAAKPGPSVATSEGALAASAAGLGNSDSCSRTMFNATRFALLTTCAPAKEGH